MIFLVFQFEKVIVMFQMCLEVGYSTVRVFTATNVGPHLFKL